MRKMMHVFVTLITDYYMSRILRKVFIEITFNGNTFLNFLLFTQFGTNILFLCIIYYYIILLILEVN